MCLLHVVSVIKVALYHISHHIVQLEGVCGGVAGGGGGTTVNSTRLLENTFSFEPVCVCVRAHTCVPHANKATLMTAFSHYIFIY